METIMTATVGGRGARALALMVGTFTLVACGGGEKGGNAAAGGAESTAAPAGSTSTSTPSATAGGSTSAAGATTSGAAAPITGKTVDVKMIGDAQGYRFDPASVTIHPGDGVRWTMVTGGPHNVTFWPDSIPAGMQSTLQANMPNTMSPLAGPLLASANQTYTISFAGAKPGVYKYYCTPHLAMGMKGQITVQ
jgi:plastocyanin